MKTLAKTSLHHGTKRSGVSAMMYCVRQAQPSNPIFAGLLDWEVSGP